MDQLEAFDFDAFNAARREERGEAPTFKLSGEVWTGIPGADFSADMAIDAAVLADDLAFAHALLQRALGADQYERLLAACRAAEGRAPVVPETLIEVARRLLAAYTGRPTPPSSSTAGGQRSDGDGSSTESPPEGSET